MRYGLAARNESCLRCHEPHELRTVLQFHRDQRADAMAVPFSFEPDLQPMRASRRRAVLENRNRVRKIRRYQIKIAVAIEVSGRGAIAHGVLVESPLCGSVGQLQATLIAEGEVFLAALC